VKYARLTHGDRVPPSHGGSGKFESFIGHCLIQGRNMVEWFLSAKEWKFDGFYDKERLKILIQNLQKVYDYLERASD
jgi:hypothetical protein